VGLKGVHFPRLTGFVQVTLGGTNGRGIQSTVFRVRSNKPTSKAVEEKRGLFSLCSSEPSAKGGSRTCGISHAFTEFNCTSEPQISAFSDEGISDVIFPEKPLFLTSEPPSMPLKTPFFCRPQIACYWSGKITLFSPQVVEILKRQLRRIREKFRSPFKPCCYYPEYKFRRSIGECDRCSDPSLAERRLREALRGVSG